MLYRAVVYLLRTQVGANAAVKYQTLLFFSFCSFSDLPARGLLYDVQQHVPDFSRSDVSLFVRLLTLPRKVVTSKIIAALQYYTSV